MQLRAVSPCHSVDCLSQTLASAARQVHRTGGQHRLISQIEAPQADGAASLGTLLAGSDHPERQPVGASFVPRVRQRRSEILDGPDRVAGDQQGAGLRSLPDETPPVRVEAMLQIAAQLEGAERVRAEGAHERRGPAPIGVIGGRQL